MSAAPSQAPPLAPAVYICRLLLMRCILEELAWTAQLPELAAVRRRVNQLFKVSLRAGHATAAAVAGASERSIMQQTGHRSVQMVRRYIRDGSLFRENGGGKWGL